MQNLAIMNSANGHMEFFQVHALPKAAERSLPNTKQTVYDVCHTCRV